MKNSRKKDSYNTEKFSVQEFEQKFVDSMECKMLAKVGVYPIYRFGCNRLKTYKTLKKI